MTALTRSLLRYGDRWDARSAQIAASLDDYAAAWDADSAAAATAQEHARQTDGTDAGAAGAPGAPVHPSVRGATTLQERCV